jgi:PBP1b-binding outer membrane lipoprotein LpoB
MKKYLFLLLVAVLLSSCCEGDTCTSQAASSASQTTIPYSSDGVQADLARWKKAHQDCWIEMWEETTRGTRIKYRCQ